MPGTGITLSTLPPYKVLSGARSPHPSLSLSGGELTFVVT